MRDLFGCGIAEFGKSLSHAQNDSEFSSHQSKYAEKRPVAKTIS
jgi:hypothetical protein